MLVLPRIMVAPNGAKRTTISGIADGIAAGARSGEGAAHA
jgi:hypothetical protein